LKSRADDKTVGVKTAANDKAAKVCIWTEELDKWVTDKYTINGVADT
jgi:hypothetical protein